MDTLRRLQDWYKAQCNGDWEHSYGLKIDTLDNPGWLIQIDLSETLLEFRPFETVELGDSQVDPIWLHCRVELGKFHAACGASQLQDALEAFLRWAEAPDE